jgi:hypothetical protein
MRLRYLKYDAKNGLRKVKTRTAVIVSSVALLMGGSGGLSMLLLSSASADTPTTNLVVTPTSTVYDSNNVTGVATDSAPGFAHGSLASDGSGKTDIYITPEMLFGHGITLGDIDSMSYWTKKSSNHVVDPTDWFVNIYTKPYIGDISTPSWYGDRIGTEPYFAVNLNDPANTWNMWSTGSIDNQLRFFESTAGAPGATFGSYTDSTWSDFVAGTALSGQAYATQSVLFISPQTGSTNANGFTGQIDGLTIILKDGSVATVNFEAFNVVNSKDQCKNSSWKSAVDANGDSFKNQGLCVSYVASNGKSQH